MAVSSKFTQKSLFGGGSTKSNTPKIDTSYGANLGGGQQNNIVNLPTLSGGGNSGGLTSANENVLKKTLGNTPTVTIPQNLTYQNNLKNMTGIIGQGGASGGVTDEGVIVGNPNVEKMPTINRTAASGSKPQTSPMTYGQQLAAAAQQQTPTESTPDTSGGTGATGSTGATGGSTTGSGEVDTYEEFLLKQEGFYKEQLDKLNAQIEQNRLSAIQLAEQQRQQIEKQAETERQRGVIDARSSYAQNLATYGANAEQLAAMGLSGSGYSEYLNQQAYATQRSETQNANAQAQTTKLNAQSAADAAKLEAEQQANADRMNAELSYAQNMQNNAMQLAQYQQQKAEEAKAEEEQKYQNYLALLDAAKSGNYTSEEISQIAQNYGFDEAMVESLTNAASTAQSEQKTEEAKAEEEQKYQNYLALLDAAKSGNYTSEEIASLGAQYGLDEAQISQLQAAAVKSKNNSLADIYRTESANIQNEGSYYDTTYLDILLKNGDIDQETYNGLMKQYADVVAEESDSETLGNLHEEGKIDDATYQAKIDEWNKDIDTSTTFFNGADYTAGKQAYEEVINNPWTTDETKEKLKASYTRAYAEYIAKENLANGLSANKVTGDMVDVNSSNFNVSQFGDFQGGGNQTDLFNAYISDARAGKIPVGMVCQFNYGETFYDHGYYVYVGDGVFVKYNDPGTLNKGTIYYPSGFKKGVGYRIVKG